MPQTVNLADIFALSIEERLTLVQAIWDSIAAETDPLELTEVQRCELDRRIADLDANPQNVLTWEQIKAHVRRER